MDAATGMEKAGRRDRIFSLAIPACAFGGILAGIALQGAGIDADIGSAGCIAASFILGYFALIKPRKDIVAICTPIYAIILFVVPGDLTHTLLLQVLFAASITVLLIRLNMRFGSLGDTLKGSPMEKFLRDYIERFRPDVPVLAEKDAHRIASAFLAFKFGLFAKAAEECQAALSTVPEGKGAAALKKALQAVLVNARDLDNSRVTADSSVSFTPEEKAYCPIVIPDERNEDPASLTLDNALVLVYVAALIRSPEDADALEEHRNYIIRILTSYKSALGIV